MGEIPVRHTGPVTQRQSNFRESQQLISTTTEKGVITYANTDFCNIAGYTQDELLGQAHNIVRHPDMPAAAFEQLWGTLKQGRPWIGVVKNRCKNGDYYWVDAFVSPIRKQGQTTGYQSVRRKVGDDITRRASELYAAINGTASTWALRKFRLLPKAWGQFACVGIAATAACALILQLGAGTALAAGAGVATSLALGWWLALPYRAAARQAKQVCDDELAQLIYTNRHDELGALMLAQHFYSAQTNTVIQRMADVSERLDAITDVANAACRDTHQAIEVQKHEVTQISVALSQMGASVEEVNRSTHNTTQATHDAQTKAQFGKRQVQETAGSIHGLAEDVTKAASVIGELQNDCQSISSVVDVIRGIAEQTNLLALNAAIEAARAGDQGRGFAVVADEVRALAKQTAESTQRIQSMIEQLQAIAGRAVMTMQHGTEQAQQCVAKINGAGESLDVIDQAVAHINEMSQQMSAAMEGQAVTTREIQGNVGRLEAQADGTAISARRTLDANQQVGMQAQELNEVVSQFSS